MVTLRAKADRLGGRNTFGKLLDAATLRQHPQGHRDTAAAHHGEPCRGDGVACGSCPRKTAAGMGEPVQQRSSTARCSPSRPCGSRTTRLNVVSRRSVEGAEYRTARGGRLAAPAGRGRDQGPRRLRHEDADERTPADRVPAASHKALEVFERHPAGSGDRGGSLNLAAKLVKRKPAKRTKKAKPDDDDGEVSFAIPGLFGGTVVTTAKPKR